MFSIYDGRDKFYQWDKDRKLIVDDPTITQVHFANCLCPDAQVSEVYTHDDDFGGIRLVNVPNDLLTEYMDIRVWGYDGEMTRYDDLFEVVKRTKPSDYIYTPTEVLTLGALEARIAALEDALKPVAFTVDGVEYVVDGKMTWQKAAAKNALGPIKQCMMCYTQYTPFDVRDGYVYKMSSYEECMNCWGGGGKDAGGACATCGETGYFEMLDLCENCGGSYNALYTSQGELVKADDYIVEGEAYSAKPRYITFTIDGKEYQTKEGSTWYSFCYSIPSEGNLRCPSCFQLCPEYQVTSCSYGYEGVAKINLSGTWDCNVCYGDTTTEDNLDKVCEVCGHRDWINPNILCMNCGGLSGTSSLVGLLKHPWGDAVDADEVIEPMDYHWDKEAF